MALQEPVPEEQHLVTREGVELVGYVFGRGENGELLFVVPFEGGEAEYVYMPEQVEVLRFAGEADIDQLSSWVNAGNEELVLEVIEAIYRPRAPYLDLLSPADRAELAELVPWARRAGDPYLAVGMARRLLMASQSEALSASLHDQILLAYLDLPLAEDTRVLAEEWIAREPRYGRSALGWVVLARLEFEAGNYEVALNTVLKPIVFSSQYPMEYLYDAYAMAIMAAANLGEKEQAQALLDEMNARNLPVPEDRAVIGYYE